MLGFSESPLSTCIGAVSIKAFRNYLYCMKRIRIDNQTVKVPENWNEITLGFYETWYHKKPLTNREKVELTAQICQTEPERLLSAPAKTFNRIAELLSFAFTNNTPTPTPSITIKGIRYTISAGDELTLAQWVDADEVQKSGEKPLSGLLAIVCLPPREKYDPARFDERQQLFASLKMSEALGVLGFFLHCNNRYANLLQTCSELRKATALLLKDTKTFRLGGDGTKLSQIWRAIKFSILMMWLRYRLRRFLRLSAT